MYFYFHYILLMGNEIFPGKWTWTETNQENNGENPETNQNQWTAEQAEKKLKADKLTIQKVAKQLQAEVEKLAEENSLRATIKPQTEQLLQDIQNTDVSTNDLSKHRYEVALRKPETALSFLEDTIKTPSDLKKYHSMSVMAVQALLLDLWLLKDGDTQLQEEWVDAMYGDKKGNKTKSSLFGFIKLHNTKHPEKKLSTTVDPLNVKTIKALVQWKKEREQTNIETVDTLITNLENDLKEMNFSLDNVNNPTAYTALIEKLNTLKNKVTENQELSLTNNQQQSLNNLKIQIIKITNFLTDFKKDTATLNTLKDSFTAEIINPETLSQEQAKQLKDFKLESILPSDMKQFLKELLNTNDEDATQRSTKFTENSQQARAYQDLLISYKTSRENVYKWEEIKKLENDVKNIKEALTEGYDKTTGKIQKNQYHFPKNFYKDHTNATVEEILKMNPRPKLERPDGKSYEYQTTHTYNNNPAPQYQKITSLIINGTPLQDIRDNQTYQNQIFYGDN